MSSFDQLVIPLIAREGGYVNDPNDSGGETKYGITVACARRNGYNGLMVNFPESEAKRIYRKEYWDSLRLDEIAAVSPEIAEELFDTGVNCGIGVAGKYLQRCLNVLNRAQKDYADLVVDGGIGSKTIATLIAYVNVRGLKGLKVLHTALNCLQGASYIELAERRVKDEAFVYGWIKERVSSF